MKNQWDHCQSKVTQSIIKLQSFINDLYSVIVQFITVHRLLYYQAIIIRGIITLLGKWTTVNIKKWPTQCTN